MKKSMAFVGLLLATIGAHTRLATATTSIVPTNAWSATGDMTTIRAGAAATLLGDGLVLITGGVDDRAATACAERFNVNDHGFLPAPAMASPRANHTSTLLNDGRVLVAGGASADGRAISSAELFDPVLNQWLPTGSLNVPRRGHTATLLPDGTVLLAGGDDSGIATATLELFDPASETFTLINGALSVAKTMHAAARLADGLVLIAGGFDGTSPVASTDIYDPTTGFTAAAPDLSRARAGLTLTTLITGEVLVVGGADAAGELSSAELFDPKSGAFRPTADGLGSARRDHLALLMPHNNAVLIVGGTASGVAVPGAEVFVPWEGPDGAFCSAPVCASGYAGPPPLLAARAWAAASPLSFPASETIRSGPTDGALLLAGGSGSRSAELFGFATIRTDRADYAPGETVTISGSGWQPGETVALMLVESPAYDEHPLVSVSADENGNIVSTEFQPDEHDLNVRFYLTAYGSVSQAQTTFTDGPADTFQFATSGLPAGTSISVSWNGFNNGNGKPISGSVTFTTPGPSTGGQNPGVSPNTVFAYAFPSPITVGGTIYQFSSGAPSSPFTTDPNGGVQTTVTGTYVPAVAATTLSASAAAGTYGGTTTVSATLTSGASGVNGKTITFQLNGSSVGTAITNNAGTATLNNVSLAGIGAGTYTSGVSASFAGDSSYRSATGTNALTIAKASLTVTAEDKTRAYGDANPPLTASYSGFVSGENLATSGVSGAPSLTTAASATSSVAGSPYTIFAGQGSLAATNYSFVFSNGTLTVTAAALAVKADDASRQYGDPNPAFTGSVSGAKNGEIFVVTASSMAAPTSVVGSYAIVPAVAGATLANYIVTKQNGTLTITAASLTVKADDGSREYGDPNPTFTGSATGAKNGETFTVTATSPATPTSAVGSYAIVPDVTGATLANYVVTKQNGTLTITTAPLTVKANDADREYGDPNPTFTGSVSGMKNAETFTITASSTATLTSVVGSYAIVPDVTGATLSNYHVTKTDGRLSITPAGLNVTANDASREYGDANPPFTGSASGAKNGESFVVTASSSATPTSTVGSYAIVPDVTGATLSNYTITKYDGTLKITAAPLTLTADDVSRAYGDANPVLTGSIVGLKNGDAITDTFVTSATPASSVGTYDIAPAPVDCVPGKLANYNVALVNGHLTVTRRHVAVTADAKSKIYGETDPGLTYQLTGGSLVNGDHFTGSLDRTLGENVGAYSITQGTLTAGGNYDLEYGAGILTIERKPATVSPAAASKIYGSADPTFGGTLTGFLAADNVTAAYTRTAGEPVGSYVISASLAPAAVLGNYAITYKTATFSIAPKTLVGHVTADDKVYDGGTSATISSRTLEGVVETDNVSYVGGTATFGDKHVGAGKSVTAVGLGLSGADSGNYNVNTSAVTAASITPHALTISAVPNTKMYDATIVASATPTVAGVQAGDGVSGLSETYDTKHVGVGKTLSVAGYTVNDGNAGHNYTVTTMSSTGGAITKAPLTITAQANTKVYDATTGAAAIPLVGGVLTGDTVSGLVESYDNSNAGTGKTLSVSTFTINDGNAGGNYDVSRIARIDGVITKADQTITWVNPAAIVYGTPLGAAQLNAVVSGVSGGSAPGGPTYTPPAGTVLGVGTNALHVDAAATMNYNAAQKDVIVSVIYGSGVCAGEAGHQILQPVNIDGTSVFKQGSTVPAKFRVCDANGNPVGAAGVVTGFALVQTTNGTIATAINEAVDSTTPDSTFRWDPSGRLWIFNISTKNYGKNITYAFRVQLNDGTSINFQFGLR